jgi:NAD+ diphosphatase
VAALRADPQARTVVIAADQPVLANTGRGAGARFSFAETAGFGKPKEVALLGRDAAGPIFATLVGKHNLDALRQRSDIQVVDMRTIAVRNLVPPEEVAVLGTAKALLDWHRRHRFCANCGTGTGMSSGGWRRDCEGCGSQHFPRTDPVSIMLATRGDRCVLGRQARFVKGSYSCLAGFIEPGETIEVAVRRELKEEAGIVAGTVRYLFSQPWPFPSSLMIGCHAEALHDDIVVDRTELEDARWFAREEVAMMLAGRHPDGLIVPPPMAIAHHLIRAWVLGAA